MESTVRTYFRGFFNRELNASSELTPLVATKHPELIGQASASLEELKKANRTPEQHCAIINAKLGLQLEVAKITEKTSDKSRKFMETYAVFYAPRAVEL